MDPTLLELHHRGNIPNEFLVRAPEAPFDEVVVLRGQRGAESWRQSADAEMEDDRQKVAEEDLVGSFQPACRRHRRIRQGSRVQDRPSAPVGSP